MKRFVNVLSSIFVSGLMILGHVVSAQVNKLKKILLIVVGACVLLTGVMITCSVAAPLSGGDTQVAPIDEYKIKVGLQHRVMWNYSNIPLSGVTTAADTKDYDFF